MCSWSGLLIRLTETQCFIAEMHPAYMLAAQEAWYAGTSMFPETISSQPTGFSTLLGRTSIQCTRYHDDWG